MPGKDKIMSNKQSDVIGQATIPIDKTLAAADVCIILESIKDLADHFIGYPEYTNAVVAALCLIRNAANELDDIIGNTIENHGVCVLVKTDEWG
jgi:hypothetical protein